MITQSNLFGNIKDLLDNNIVDVCGDGAPTSGTSGTGVNICGPGSRYVDYTNAIVYVNTNTKASPTWTAVLSTTGTQTLTNKTLTAPVITAPAITGATTIGTGATITTPIIVSPITTFPVQALAAAGADQAGAGAITATAPGIVVVSAADDTKGVVLPGTATGKLYIIKSTVSNKILKVYPASGGTINALAGDAAISLASGPTIAMFVGTSATQWYTLPLLPS